MAHLRDLIGSGETVTITDSGDNEYKIFVVRPSSLQQDRARSESNGAMARAKLEALEKRGDKYDALKMSFAELTDQTELVERRLAYEEGDIRDAAFNEVLYGLDDDGEPNMWQKDDYYLEIVSGLAKRATEIKKYNDQMKEGGGDDLIIEDEDDELQALIEQQEQFRAAVDEVVEKKLAIEKVKFVNNTVDELREDLLLLALDLEAKMGWYQDFQLKMLYFACRYDDDKKKFYFDSPDDVGEIPDYVRSQLFNAYERIERGSGDLKNSLSPPNS